MESDSVCTEARNAVRDGADEIDMVIPVGLIKSNKLAAAEKYVAKIKESIGGTVLKVILETALLDPEEIVAACSLSVSAGANFVKTSTGFNPAGGATEEVVRLMRETVGEHIGVKASGGIRSLADVECMINAGASRLGMSATTAVIDEINRTTSAD